MNTRNAALVFGVVFLLAGISGFFPAPISPGAPPLMVEMAVYFGFVAPTTVTRRV